MNPNWCVRYIREAFKTDEYQILLVANKFQTGFDQPLLCGMYVDTLFANQHTSMNLWMELMTADDQLIKALGGGWNVSHTPGAVTP
ncbi:MAG: hypothetical protein ABI197_06470 [Granulicella sp.]